MSPRDALVRYFCPKLLVRSVLDIELKNLASRGINTLLFDLDNTLLSWREKEISNEIADWIKKAGAAGYKMHIVSNSLRGRVERISRQIGIPALASGVKPRKKAFMTAIKSMQSAPPQTAVIGDQIFTDILGGNRLGLFTILVFPVDKKELFTTGLLRLPERMLLRFFERRGLINYQIVTH